MTKVLFFGTHPSCYNGYCLVTYNLAKQLSIKDDIQFIIYGFQNFNASQSHIEERRVPSNVYIYDAFANETPKMMGFGFEQVKDVVAKIKPDLCVLYNDMVVVSNIMNRLREIPNPTFKTIVYIDQVYLYQKTEYVKLLNNQADYVMCFTPYWEEIAKGIGITKPTGFLQHGFDPMVHYPVPKQLARQYYGLKKDDFIIMNLNRNQPRKRWDICLKAFAEVVARHIQDPIKLLIATAVQGAWNLVEVYERELKKRGITLEEGMKHIILIDNPQQLTDEEINILYNVADIGINTCDGEGFGLCNFQQAAIGIPQIVPSVGGFLDFFKHKDTAFLVEPKFTLYIDSGRDGVGGECQICDPNDFVEQIEYAYSNLEEMREIGQRARKHICKYYKWEDIGDKFYKIIKQVCNGPLESVKPQASQVSQALQVPKEEAKVPLALLEQWEKELKDVSALLPDARKYDSTPEESDESNQNPKESPVVQRIPLRIIEEEDSQDSEIDEHSTPVLLKKPELSKPIKKKIITKSIRKPQESTHARLKKKVAEREELLALKEKIDYLLSKSVV